MGGGDASTVLLGAVNDLIFETKIRTTANGLGISAVTTRDATQVPSLLDAHHPALLLVDLNTLGPGAIDAVRAGCTHPAKPYVLAFVSHVDQRLAQEASAAGAHQVLARSKFSSQLPQLLTQHCGGRH